MENVNELSKLASKDYSILDVNSSFLKLVNLIEQDNFQSILLTDSKNHLSGFISLEQVLKNGKNEISLKKIQLKLPYLREFNLEKIIKCYLDKNTLLVPIIDQKESIKEVVNLYKVSKEYLFDLTFETENILESVPFTVHKDEKIDQLMSEIKKSYLDTVIVEENGSIFGSIDSRKLANLLIKPESTSRGEKKGEKQKFEGTVENFIVENDDLFIRYQEKYTADNLVEIMEKNSCPLLYVKDANNKLVGMVKLKKLLKLSLQTQTTSSEPITVSILSAPDNNIEQISKKKIMTLIERHSKFFNIGQESEGTVRFRKIENQSQKGMFRYETDVRISFGKGKDSVFAVKADDWGAEKSLNKAYSKISRLISDKRKISRDSYLKKDINEELNKY